MASCSQKRRRSAGQTNSGTESINGIYQTRYSWIDGEFAEEYKNGSDKLYGAVVELQHIFRKLT